MKLILVVISVALLLNYIDGRKVAQGDLPKPKHGEELDWWENGVFYQIYPLSFKDSVGNDGYGDLRGITEKLPHLKELGVTGVWLSPIFKSKMVDFGYDVSDFKTIHEWFGTDQDFDALMAEAKRLEIKIILDFVPNHTSDEHDWFKRSADGDLEYLDYYVWREGKPSGLPPPNDLPLPPNNWLAVFHTQAWTYHQGRGMYYLHQFTKEQPDLNFRNPKVVEEIRNMLRYWLNKGVDGFRIDAINHMVENADFLDEPYIDANGDKTDYENLNHIYTKDLQESYNIIYDIRDLFDNEYKAVDGVTRLMMTEAYADIDKTMLWYGNNQNRKGGHIPFNFALIMNLDAQSTANQFKFEIDQWISKMPAGGRANWVLGNHDRKRIASRYGEDRVESLAILSLTLPGIAVIYYGEEIGMSDNPDITWDQGKDPQGCNTNSSVFLQFTRDPVRTPFQWDSTTNGGFSTGGTPWLPVNRNYVTLNLANQRDNQNSVFNLYKRLIAMKKEEHSLIWGDMVTKSLNSNRVLAYTRVMNDHDFFIIAINLGTSDETVDLTVFDESLTNDSLDSYYPDKGHVMATNAKSKFSNGQSVELKNLVLGRYDAVVLHVPRSAAVGLSVSIILMAIVVLRAFFN